MTDREINTNSILIFIFGFLSGVLASSFVFVAPLVSVFIVLVGLAVPAAEKIWNREISKEVLFLSLAFISFGLGILRYSIKDFHEPLVPAASGTIVSEPEHKENTIRFVMLSDNGEKVLINTDLYSPAQYGDRILATGKLERPGIIDPSTSSGQATGRPFDYAAYLAKDGIYYILNFADVEVVSHGHGNLIKTALIKIKQSYVDKVREILSEPESSLLAGFTVAGKNALPKDILEQFRRAGVIHIVVLSGYHVTLITIMLFWLFGFVFLRLRSGSKFARLATVAGLVTFVLMAGASASILRAATMALIAVGSKLIRRVYDASRALVTAAFIMVTINPKVLVFDVGFQLSFLATAGIIYLYPIFNAKLAKSAGIIPPAHGQKGNSRPILSRLISLLAITLAAQVAVSPYLLYAMGNVSLVALLANVLIIPAVPAAMITGFIAALLAFFSPLIALPFSYLAHLFLAWILAVSGFLGNLSFSLLVIPRFPFWGVLVLYALIIIFVKCRSLQQSSVPRTASSSL